MHLLPAPICFFHPHSDQRVTAARLRREGVWAAAEVAKTQKPRKTSTVKPSKLPPHLASLPPELQAQLLDALKRMKS